jgi:hypothetical protein
VTSRSVRLEIAPISVPAIKHQFSVVCFESIASSQSAFVTRLRDMRPHAPAGRRPAQPAAGRALHPRHDQTVPVTLRYAAQPASDMEQRQWATAAPDLEAHDARRLW